MIRAGLFLGLFLVVGALYGESAPVRLDADWEYCWADSLEELRDPERTFSRCSESNYRIPDLWSRNERDSRFLALRVKMPEGYRFSAPAIYLERLFMIGEVHLDGGLIYSFGDLDAGSGEWFQGTDWHLVPLPADWHGKTLTIFIRSDFPVIGVRPPVLVGNREDLIRRIIIRDAPELIFSIILLSIGLVTLGLAAVPRFKRVISVAMGTPSDPGTVPEKVLAPGIPLLEIGSAVYLLSFTSIKTLLIDNPVVWMYLWITSTAVMIIGALWYVRNLVPGRVSRLLPLLMSVHGTYTLMTIAVFALGWYQYALTIASGRLFLYAVETALVIPVLVVGVRERRLRSRLPSALVMIVLVYIIIHVVVTGEYTRFHGVANRWLLEVFMVGMALLILRRIYRAFQVAGRYRRDIEDVRRVERQQIYADIHDHLGANLNDLAIKADRGGDPGTAAEIRNALRILRGELTAQEDNRTLEKDFLLGFRLMLVRRYTAAGRTVRIEISQATVRLFPKPPDRDFVHGIDPILKEIVTNDLKYGYGMSYWTVTARETAGGGINLQVGIVAPTRYVEESAPGEHRRGGRGRNNLLQRIGEMAGCILKGPEIITGEMYAEPIPIDAQGCRDREYTEVFAAERYSSREAVLFRFSFEISPANIPHLRYRQFTPKDRECRRC